MPLDMIRDPLDTSAFDFHADIEPLFYLDHAGNMQEVDPDIQRGVFRYDPATSEKMLLATCGSRYKLLPHKAAFDAVADAMRESNLDCTDVEVKDEVLEYGAKAKRTVIFKRHQIEPAVGDYTQFKVELFNSYDGAWSFQLYASALRLWCLNGCTTPDAAVRTNKKHTTNIRVENEASRLNRALDVFHDSEDRYRRYMQIKVSEDQARHLFAATLAHNPSPGDPSRVNRKMLDDLMGQWFVERRGLGATAWAAYNTATYWSSHLDDIRGKTHTVQRTREGKVASMLNSKHWKELVS